MIPSSCCVTGHLHKGSPKGTIELSLHGVNMYVARPPALKDAASTTQHAAIVILTDVFGWATPNIRLIADTLAEQSGIIVYVPDFFQGDPVPLEMFPAFERHGVLGKVKDNMDVVAFMLKLGPWTLKHKESVVLPLMDAVLGDLRSNGVTKIGAIGYCWGGKYSVLLGGREFYGIQAAVQCHPSMLKKEVVAKLRVPSLWNCAEEDPMFTPKLRKQSEEILKKNRIPHEFIDYPGTLHGFAVRGDVKDEKLKMAVDRTITESSKFFRTILLA